MQKRLPSGDHYLRSLPAILALAAIYFVCGKATLSFATLTGYITPVWPVSGIALAALLLFGRRLAPGIFLGALTLHLASHGLNGLNLLGGSCIGLGNMLTTAVLAGLIQRKITVDKLLERSRHVFWFVGLILPIPIVSATIGVTVLYLTGITPVQHYAASWWTWGVSNLFGILIVTPAMVAWQPGRSGRLRPHGQRIAEVLLMTIAIVAIYGLSFWANTQLWHLLIPIVVWSAFRFGPRGTTLLIVLITTMEVFRIVQQSRGIPLDPPMAMNSALLLFQSFIGVITLTTLMLTAVIAERRHAEQGQVRANSELNTLTRLLQDSNAALTRANDELESRVEKRTRALKLEQEKSESLLLNILPKAIAQRLKHEPRPIANAFDEVTVLFADIVNFSEVSSHVSPRELLQILNQIFSAFDCLSEKYGVEKIKTIGDAYMAVAGVPEPQPRHADVVAQMAIEMLQVIDQLDIPGGYQPSLRIGINTGPVVAGVIGTKKFIYDLWGDTVNVASRMESLGEPNRIQVTEGTYQRLSRRFTFEARGPIEVKGKGPINTYWLVDAAKNGF